MATADPTQDTLASLNRLFDRLDKVSQPFNEQGGVLSKAVPFEMNAQNGQIQPAGWVQNADTDSGIATVTIDSTGITILNGKIFLYDYTGSSVLGAAGFDGSWVEYIANGLYNSQFNAGSLSSGLSDTTTGASYELSLSPDIPFWVIVNSTGIPTYGIVEVSGTRYFETTIATLTTAMGQVDMTIYQDVPVAGASDYFLDAKFTMGGWTGTGNEVLTLTLDADWRDADHDLISDVTSVSDSLKTWAGDTVDSHLPFIIGTAPATARYMRVYAKMSFATIGASIFNPYIRLQGFTLQRVDAIGKLSISRWEVLGTYGFHSIYNDSSNQRLVIESGGGVSIKNETDGVTGSDLLRLYSSNTGASEWAVGYDGKMYFGSAYDTNLYRSAANTLTTDDEFHALAGLSLGTSAAPPSTTGIAFGSDTNLYRVAANALRTDDAFSIGQSASTTQGFGMFVTGDSAYRYRIFQSGTIEWGAGGASATDVNLYRAAANVLKTDDSMVIGGTLDLSNTYGWTNASMQNSWVVYDTARYTPGYFKDEHGIVHLRGLIKSGTVGASCFTLPAGYRPAHTVIVSCHLERCGRSCWGLPLWGGPARSPIIEYVGLA